MSKKIAISASGIKLAVSTGHTKFLGELKVKVEDQVLEQVGVTSLSLKDSEAPSGSVLDGAPSWPRSSWQKSKFYAHAHLLEYGHSIFRRNCSNMYLVFSKLKISTQKECKESHSLLLSLHKSFTAWHDAMNNGHEHFEEVKLYPYLEAKYNISFDYLSKEHGDMHEGRDRTLKALTGLIGVLEKAWKSPKIGEEVLVILQKGKDSLIQEMDSYDQVLMTHLMEEEEVIIPLLLIMDEEEYGMVVDSPLNISLGRLKKRKQKMGGGGGRK